MNISDIEINNIYIWVVILFFIIFILYNYTTKTSPIIKQLNEYKNSKTDNIIAAINNPTTNTAVITSCKFFFSIIIIYNDDYL